MNYQERGTDIGKLVDEKQAQYGDAISATGDIMETIFPEGIPKEKMKDALLIVRILDKICRLSLGNGEGGESPFRDIAGYGLLGINLHELMEEEKSKCTNVNVTNAFDYKNIQKGISEIGKKFAEQSREFADLVRRPATGGFVCGVDPASAEAENFLTWEEMRRIKVRYDGTLYVEPEGGGEDAKA